MSSPRHFRGFRPANARILFTVLGIFLAAQNGHSDRVRPYPLSSRPPLRSISALANDSPLIAGHQVLVRGVVTYLGNRAPHNTTVYIQDQTGAIPLTPSKAPSLALGDEVEVLGTYHRNADQSFIENAEIHQLWSGSDPVPLALRPDQAVEGAYNGWLVQIQGRLIQKTLNAQRAVLALEGEHQFYTAILDLSTPGFSNILSAYQPGMVLELTGVCSARPEGLSSPPSGFVVLLRSLDDIRVVRPGPWFNFRHVLILTPFLLALLLLLHRIHIHNLNLRFRAVIDERSRIAREIHDTMAQGFTGVALQLEGVADELRISGPLRETHQNLDIALRMVRHCREEAHNSIFVLRSLTMKHVDLLSTLIQSAELKMAGNPVEISSMREGTPFPISDEVKQNLLRIGQEAISNALRHAHSTQLHLRLCYLPQQLELIIVDNGIGFESTSTQSTRTGHFGLTGMRERAAAINAALEIHSSNNGTQVRVAVSRKLGLTLSISHRMRRILFHV